MYGVIAAAVVAIVIFDATDLLANFAGASAVIAPQATVAADSVLLRPNTSAFAVDRMPAKFAK